MKDNRNTEKKLASAVSRMIPEDMFDRIEQGIAQPQERTILMTTPKKKTRILPRLTGILVAACLLLAVGLVGFNHYNDHLKIASTVDIDVNPSIEISANRNDRVVKVEAVNEDAEAVLGDMKLKGVDLEVAVNAIIGAMVKEGYFTSELGEILVTVHSDNADKAEEIRSYVVSDIDSALKANEVEATILNQTVTTDTPTEEAKTFAKENGVSVGKAIFVKNLAAKDETLVPEDLAKKSIKELGDVIRDKELDVRDILDYDEEHCRFDPSVEKPTPDGTDDDSESTETKLSAAEAKDVVLAHAGFEKKNVTFVKVKIDEEDGRLVYEVEFIVNRVEYEYEIDAVSGEILSAEKEDREEGRRPVEPDGTKDNGKEPRPEDSRPEGGRPVEPVETAPVDAITPEAAEDAALAHAGVFRETIIGKIHTQLDEEDGKYLYEIEFRTAETEYEYEVDALTGEILNAETEAAETDDRHHGDRPDESRPADAFPAETRPEGSRPEEIRPVEPVETAPVDAITPEAAEDAALAHAGVARENVVGRICTRLDEEDGKYLYEIEFRTAETEYEYEVDALTGEILKAETEAVEEDDRDHEDRPIDPRPEGSRPEENRPAETRPEDSLPEEIRPAETRPEDSLPEEIRPAETRPEGSRPEEIRPTEPVETAPEGVLAPEAAEDAALAHAGVARDVVGRICIRLDEEDGKYLYEMEFRTAETEYDYEVDALTGAILNAETEAIEENDRHHEERPIEIHPEGNLPNGNAPLN